MSKQNNSNLTRNGLGPHYIPGPQDDHREGKEMSIYHSVKDRTLRLSDKGERLILRVYYGNFLDEYLEIEKRDRYSEVTALYLAEFLR